MSPGVDVSEALVMDTRPMQAGRVPKTTRVLMALRSVAALGYVPGIPLEDRALMLDTSHYNGNADLSVAVAKGVAALYNKATESNWYKDPTFAVNRAKAKALSLAYGGYHFLRPSPGGAIQAAHYLNITDNEADCDLINTVDIEVVMSAAAIRAYVEYILERRGYFPMIYTSHYCWSLVAGETDKAWLVARCPLFVAHWGATNPLLPPGWGTFKAHQFSANNNGRAAEFGFTAGDPDIDLSWVRKSWLAQYAAPPPAPITLPELEAQVAGIAADVERIKIHLGMP